MSKAAEAYFDIIREHLTSDYNGMYREAGEKIKYPFLTPGSEQYADVLWDWDSWWSNIALRQILREVGEKE
ncbi:MAG: glycoside hydrolase family 37, partial [Candidatus Sumerlaeota bacterium]